MLLDLPPYLQYKIVEFVPSLLIVHRTFAQFAKFLLSLYCKFCKPLRRKGEAACSCCGWKKKLTIEELDKVHENHSSFLWKKKRKRTDFGFLYAYSE